MMVLKQVDQPDSKNRKGDEQPVECPRMDQTEQDQGNACEQRCPKQQVARPGPVTEQACSQVVGGHAILAPRCREDLAQASIGCGKIWPIADGLLVRDRLAKADV